MRFEEKLYMYLKSFWMFFLVVFKNFLFLPSHFPFVWFFPSNSLQSFYSMCHILGAYPFQVGIGNKEDQSVVDTLGPKDKAV